MAALRWRDGTPITEHRLNIGRYEIQYVLGQGAMGKVYLAEDPLLKRRLAVKVVSAKGPARNLALERFRAEAEISARLNHPNIVTIYDVGEDPALGPYLAMEYVEGQSLGRYIQEGTLDLETRFGILVQTMRALRAAHQHAIVHRDVKPDNLLVAKDGRVKLMDFGISRTMAPSADRPGEFLGSPAYSAPELLRGAEPTPHSDRFAFAVTAFELLTGQLPHPGDTVAAAMQHILHEDPVMPPDLPPAAAQVFRKALARDMDPRPDTLMDFLLDLIDAYPLEDAQRARIQKLFHSGDQTGDIVPVRRTSGNPGASELTARIAARPYPAHAQEPAVRIELEPDATPPRPLRVPRPPQGLQGEPARSPRSTRIPESPSGEEPQVRTLTLVLAGLFLLVLALLAVWAVGNARARMHPAIEQAG